MECRLCGEKSFSLQDGFYFCDECGTQSQDLQEQVSQVNLDSHGTLRTLHAKKTPKKTAGKDKGKPWVTYEGYQCLLKEMVDTLISHGVDPLLKETVKVIWFKYLQATGVAFTGKRFNGKLKWPKRAVRGTRDRFPGTEADPIPGRKSEVAENYVAMEDEDLLELQDEEFYEDDDPIETQLNEELEMLEKARDQQTQKSSRRKKRDNESLCSDEYNGSLNIPSNGRGFKMKQEVLISILYLGLRWLNEPITANDLSRWIQEGKLPYHKASDVLPRHMKFAGSDHIYLCSRQNVKPMKISFFAIQIVRLLRLKDFPKPNLQLLTARLIVDLDLPVYFHTLVKLLMKISHFSPEFGTSYGRKFVQKCFYLDEAIAAYIVVAVKLVYFLDGERERRGDIRVFLSRLTETPIESYYSWAHRVFLTRKRKYQFGVPMIQDHLQYVQSAKNYSAFCAREVFTSWQPREVTTNSQCTLYKHVRACLGDKKELYHQIFTSLVPELEKKIEEMKSEQSEPSSFPSGVQHLKEVYEDTPMDYIPDKVAARMDTRDVSEGYVRYLCAVGNRVFSESYEFLLETIAERISLLSSELQKFVEFVEDDLFRRARKQTPKEKNE